MNIHDMLKTHEFFRDLSSGDLKLICDCALLQFFERGDKIAHTGNSADFFYVIQSGRLSISVEMGGRGSREIQSLGEGEVVGWSWIFPPYRWSFDVSALEPTSVISFEGACVRSKCEQDPRLGYELMKRFAQVLSQRLRLTRLQLAQGPAKAVFQDNRNLITENPS